MATIPGGHRVNTVDDGPVVGASDPKSVVLRFYALLNERKFDGAFRLLSDDVEWWLSGT